MDDVINKDTVLLAIDTLYRNPNDDEKKQASAWLAEFQKSIYAWKISDELLHEKRDLESCYFAAQTMRTKIQYSFQELPSEAYYSLKESLLNHISHINENTSNVIITQLSLALADLALQMQCWENPIHDLLQMFASDQYLNPLLEIIIVLPEEISSRYLRLGANWRQEIIQRLINVSPEVINLLNSCTVHPVYGQYTSPILIKVMRCLVSWLTARVLQTDLVASSESLKKAFEIMKNSESSFTLHEAAADAICSALFLIDEDNRHRLLAEVLFANIFELNNSYQIAVAQEDSERAINFCRIFTELGEAILHVLVDGVQSQAFQVLEILLMCVTHHDYEVADVTFNFWFRLSEELYHRNNDKLNQQFNPYILRLVEALLFHCQMEPDHDEVLDEDEDFTSFRNRISDLIKDVVFIITSKACFRHLFLHVQNANSWESCEAGLFLMASISKFLRPEENELVPTLLQCILCQQTQNNHKALIHTSMLLIGELCEWISGHPDTLQSILNFLFCNMSEPKLANASAKSLNKICNCCQVHMTSYVSSLLHIAESLDKYKISGDAAIGLLKGIAVILSHLPHNQLTNILRQLCIIQMQPLQAVLNNNEFHADPVIWLDRLAALFNSVEPTVKEGVIHPCQPVVSEVWPVLSGICDKYQNDVRVMERCCRCLRFAVRRVGLESAPLLQPLIKQLVAVYQKNGHSCFLYLASILVDEYGSQPTCTTLLLNMLNSFLAPTYNLLQENDGFRQHVDTIDDFFRLCARFIQRCCVAFLQSTFIDNIVQIGLAAVTLDHREANASSVKFFVDLIDCGHSCKNHEDFDTQKALVHQILEKHGANLLNNILSACMHFSQNHMFPNISELLWEMLLYDRQLFISWFEMTLRKLPSKKITLQQITHFHDGLLSAESSKQILYSVREFSRLFR